MKRVFAKAVRKRTRTAEGPPLIERLETRRLFDVSLVQTYPGYYEVDADSSTNAINIVVSQANRTMTINGTATYSNVAYITVNGNNNGDQISVTSDDQYGSIGCAVNGGSGNDTINVAELTGVIHGGGGQDTLTLQDSWYGEVYGDSGNDNIYVIGNCADAEIEAGTGNTLVDASQSNFGVVIHGGPGNDTLYGSAYDDEIDGGGPNTVMYGVGGNDTFYSTGGVIYGSGDGTNVAYVTAGSNVQIYNVQYIYNC